MQWSRTNIGSLLVVCLLWLLVVAVTVLFGSEEVPGGLHEEPPVDRTAPGTRKVALVGATNYRGDHTWRGVIHVTHDNLEYRDGALSAECTGVPQGVTFEGNRKNVAFKNLTFNGVGDGMNIGNNQTVDDLVIENCKFVECRSPDANSADALLGGRGYGIFASGGKNWSIRNSDFQTRRRDSTDPARTDCSSQYAARLGAIHGLNVQSTRFENHAKASVWLMAVHAAAFDRSEFVGGSVRIGVRPNDMPGVQKGDCRNIIFRDCTFTFGSVDDWPASITVFPGSENILIEDCEIVTIPGCEWWLEIDSRETRSIHWRNCTWKGSKIEGYTGVRSSMSIDEMRAKDIGPIAESPRDAR
jgi:hypothetical protein